MLLAFFNLMAHWGFLALFCLVLFTERKRKITVNMWPPYRSSGLTGASRFFPEKLLSSWSVPSMNWHMGLFLPKHSFWPVDL